MLSTPGPPTSHKTSASSFPSRQRCSGHLAGAQGCGPGRGTGQGLCQSKQAGSDPTEAGQDGPAPQVAQLRSPLPRGSLLGLPRGSLLGLPILAALRPRSLVSILQGSAALCPRTAVSHPMALMPVRPGSATPSRGSGSDGPYRGRSYFPARQHRRGTSGAGFGSGMQFQPQAPLPQRNYSLCTRLPPPLPAPISRGGEGAGASPALTQLITPTALRGPWTAWGGLRLGPAFITAMCPVCPHAWSPPLPERATRECPLLRWRVNAGYLCAYVELLHGLGREQACRVLGAGCWVQGGCLPAAPGAVPWQLLSFVAASG